MQVTQSKAQKLVEKLGATNYASVECFTAVLDASCGRTFTPHFFDPNAEIDTNKPVVRNSEHLTFTIKKSSVDDPMKFEEVCTDVRRNTRGRTEVIMMRELRKLLSVDNCREVVRSNFTTASIATMKGLVTDKRYQVSNLGLGSSLLGQLIRNTSFLQMFDPEQRMENLIEGKVGSLLGIDVWTDMYRMSNEKIFHQNELWIFASPSILGACKATITELEVVDFGENYIWRCRHSIEMNVPSSDMISVLHVVEDPNIDKQLTEERVAKFKQIVI